jgi:hypothetical protein
MTYKDLIKQTHKKFVYDYSGLKAGYSLSMSRQEAEKAEGADLAEWEAVLDHYFVKPKNPAPDLSRFRVRLAQINECRHPEKALEALARCIFDMYLAVTHHRTASTDLKDLQNKLRTLMNEQFLGNAIDLLDKEHKITLKKKIEGFINQENLVGTEVRPARVFQNHLHLFVKYSPDFIIKKYFASFLQPLFDPSVPIQHLAELIDAQFLQKTGDAEDTHIRDNALCTLLHMVIEDNRAYPKMNSTQICYRMFSAVKMASEKRPAHYADFKQFVINQKDTPIIDLLNKIEGNNHPHKPASIPYLTADASLDPLFYLCEKIEPTLPFLWRFVKGQVSGEELSNAFRAIPGSIYRHFTKTPDWAKANHRTYLLPNLIFALQTFIIISAWVFLFPLMGPNVVLFTIPLGKSLTLFTVSKAFASMIGVWAGIIAVFIMIKKAIGVDKIETNESKYLALNQAMHEEEDEVDSDSLITLLYEGKCRHTVNDKKVAKKLVNILTDSIPAADQASYAKAINPMLARVFNKKLPIDQLAAYIAGNFNKDVLYYVFLMFGLNNSNAAEMNRGLYQYRLFAALRILSTNPQYPDFKAHVLAKDKELHDEILTKIERTKEFSPLAKIQAAAEDPHHTSTDKDPLYTLAFQHNRQADQGKPKTPRIFSPEWIEANRLPLTWAMGTLLLVLWIGATIATMGAGIGVTLGLGISLAAMLPGTHLMGFGLVGIFAAGLPLLTFGAMKVAHRHEIEELEVNYGEKRELRLMEQEDNSTTMHQQNKGEVDEPEPSLGARFRKFCSW